MRATLKLVASTSTTVRLTPSIATDPFAAIWASREAGAVNRQVLHSPSSWREASHPRPSTWPVTRWPPRRSESVSDRSRFTRPPGARREKVVRASVSGPSSKASFPASIFTTDRQQPLTQMLSPREALAATGPASTTSRTPGGSSMTATTVPSDSTRPVNMLAPRRTKTREPDLPQPGTAARGSGRCRIPPVFPTAMPRPGKHLHTVPTRSQSATPRCWISAFAR